MPARRADLARVIPSAAALPEQHQARVFGAFGVRCGYRMPATTVRAVQLVAGAQRRIVSMEKSRRRMLESSRTGRDSLGPAEVAVGAIDRKLVATRFTAIPITVLIKRAHCRQPHK
jgi:hypothetical protein